MGAGIFSFFSLVPRPWCLLLRSCSISSSSSSRKKERNRKTVTVEHLLVTEGNYVPQVTSSLFLSHEGGGASASCRFSIQLMLMATPSSLMSLLFKEKKEEKDSTYLLRTAQEATEGFVLNRWCSFSSTPFQSLQRSHESINSVPNCRAQKRT